MYVLLCSVGKFTRGQGESTEWMAFRNRMNICCPGECCPTCIKRYSCGTSKSGDLIFIV